MDSTKIYTAGIEYSLATEVLSGYENCGVDLCINDDSEVLEIEFCSKQGYNLSSQKLLEIKNIAINRLGQNVITGFSSVQKCVVELLKARSLKLATAESCTSGLISAKITEISGASEVFGFGLSAYSNEVKINSLHVPEAVIEKHGAVSSQTAASMAIGAMRVSGADIGLSITGVAGPGTSEGKPVGLIYVGLCDKSGLWVLKLELDGEKYNREQIRQRAANLALDFVRRYLSYEDFGANLYRGEEDYCITTDKLAMFSVDNTISYPMVSKSTSFTSANFSITKSKIINFIKDIIPTKNDKFSDLIRKSVAILLIILSIVFSVSLSSYFSAESKEISLNNSLIQKHNEFLGQFNEYHLDNNGTFLSLSSLKNKNNDLQGWISNNYLSINSAVMKSDAENFYAKNNFEKQPSKYGMIYVDSDCDISTTSRSKNVILYGSNISNKFAFGNLDQYLNINFYRTNPIIKFDSYNDKGKYIIFSVVKLKEGIDKEFDYRKINFENSSEYNSYIETIRNNSIYSVDINVDTDDDLLTLVTDLNDDVKILIFARRIKNNENLNNITATTNKINQNN